MPDNECAKCATIDPHPTAHGIRFQFICILALRLSTPCSMVWRQSQQYRCNQWAVFKFACQLTLLVAMLAWELVKEHPALRELFDL
jgi:hypothetical protein